MRRFIVSALAAAALLTGAGSASAHVIYQGGGNTGTVYESSFDCTQLRTEISHGSGGGYWKGNVWSKQFGSSNCSSSFFRPAGNLSLRVEGYKWTGSSWAICWATSGDGSGWIYNTSSSSSMEFVTSNPTNPPCGNGSYYPRTLGYLYNGSWKGGAIITNTSHVLPT